MCFPSQQRGEGLRGTIDKGNTSACGWEGRARGARSRLNLPPEFWWQKSSPQSSKPSVHDKATTHCSGTKKRCKRHATIVALLAQDQEPISVRIILRQHPHLALPAGIQPNQQPMALLRLSSEKLYRKPPGNTEISKDLLWKS